MYNVNALLMLSMLNADAPLGLSFWEILIHLFNLIILGVVVRFLLYKPIKKFMDKRKQGYIDADNAAKKLLEEAESKKAEQEELAARAKKDAVAVLESARKSAETEAHGIVAVAKAEADSLLDKAHIDADEVKRTELAKCAKEVADAAVSLAERLVMRELKETDNDAVVEEIIAGWK